MSDINWNEEINAEDMKQSAPAVNEQEQINIGINPSPSVTNWSLELRQDNKQELQRKVKGGQPVSYADTSWGKTISTALDNLPSDVVPFYRDYVSGIYEAVSNPIITGKSLKDLAIGAAKAGFLRQMSAELNMPLDQEKMAQDPQISMLMNLEEEMYNNFGTEENLKKFVAENPAEALNTLAELMIPVAKATGSKKLLTVSKNLEPVNVMSTPIRLAGKTLKNLPNNLHNRALKLFKTFPRKKVDELAALSVKNKNKFSLDSVAKLQTQIDELETLKDQAIKATSGKLPINTMFKGLDDYAESVMRVSSEGNKVKKLVQSFKKTMLKANKELQRTDLSASELNDYKVRFNKELDDFYNKVMTTTSTSPIKKEILATSNKALRETLETIVPETKLMKYPKLSKLILKKEFPTHTKKLFGDKKTISLKDINELEGNLIKLRKAIDDEVSNLQPFMNFQVGQKTATGAFGGGAVATAIAGEGAMKAGGIIGGAVGFAIGVIDSSSKIKMALGNYVASLNKVGVVTRPNATLIRMGLYEAGDYKEGVAD